MSRPTREALLRAFECYAYERRAGSDLGAENALRVGGRVYDALETAEGDLAETRRLLALAESVIRALRDATVYLSDNGDAFVALDDVADPFDAWSRHVVGTK